MATINSRKRKGQRAVFSERSRGGNRRKKGEKNKKNVLRKKGGNPATQGKGRSGKKGPF